MKKILGISHENVTTQNVPKKSQDKSQGKVTEQKKVTKTRQKVTEQKSQKSHRQKVKKNVTGSSLNSKEKTGQNIVIYAKYITDIICHYWVVFGQLWVPGTFLNLQVFLLLSHIITQFPSCVSLPLVWFLRESYQEYKYHYWRIEQHE